MLPHGWSHLRVRLMLLVLLAVVPALVLLLPTAAEQRRLAIDAVQAQALQLARLSASDQDDAIGETRQLLSILSQLPEIGAGAGAPCSSLLGRLLSQDSRYANLGWPRPTAM